MPAYPNTSFSRGSQVVARNNINLDIASDGSVRGRKIHSKETYDLSLLHTYLDEAAANTIEEFYETNPIQQVDVTWRGVVYNCYWAGKPIIEHNEGITFNVKSSLVGVRSDGY